MPAIRSHSVAAALAPWASAILAVFAGCLVTLSLAPFDLWPAGIVACALYALLLAECSERQALWRGWLFGAGLFGSGASWVYVSIHVYGHAGIPLAALLTAIFCAALALLHLLQAWLYVRFVRPLPGGMLFGFAALWALGEWLRSWLLTGFPWLYLGYAHIDSWLAGWAPIAGVFGLSFAVAFTGGCAILPGRARQAATLLACGAVLAALWIGGLLLRSVPWVTPASDQALRVAIYQPNLSLEEKWRPDAYGGILRQYLRATQPLYDYDLLLWPESAIPRVYDIARRFLDPIAARMERSGGTLITGIPTRNTSRQVFNSIVALGQGEGQYNKQRLVPFGEYVPLEHWLRGLIAFFDLPMSHMSSGARGQPPLSAGDYRVAPLICYEVAYPGLAARGARDAGLLVTISNDSWFGSSIGPLQHLQIARMRALETAATCCAVPTMVYRQSSTIAAVS